MITNILCYQFYHNISSRFNVELKAIQCSVLILNFTEPIYCFFKPIFLNIFHFCLRILKEGKGKVLSLFTKAEIQAKVRK